MIRAALRGLTTRGRSFLAAAVAAGLSAFVLGERELLQVAALLIALPLIAAVAVARTRYKLSCTRAVSPTRVQAGTTATVTLRLENLSRVPTGTLLLEEQLPPVLGQPPRFVLDKLGTQRSATVTYPIRVDVRGRYEIGPLAVRLTDPFGLCELTRSFTRTERILVIPPVTELAPITLDGTSPGEGPQSTRSAQMRGDDDATTREYQYGDDYRRVHWRSTARTGELMVRREEQPYRASATLLLDTRLSAHRGSGYASSLEWAVAGTASIAAHLIRAGFELHLLTGGDAGHPLTGPDGEEAALGVLADLDGDPSPDLRVVPPADATEPGHLLVAMLGTLRPNDYPALASLRAPGSTSVAILVDTDAWAALPPGRRKTSVAAYDASVQRLAAAGWRVLAARQGARISALWPLANGTAGAPGVGAPGVAPAAAPIGAAGMNASPWQSMPPMARPGVTTSWDRP
jgi:uncharacterized protein (DUF58 family)